MATSCDVAAGARDDGLAHGYGVGVVAELQHSEQDELLEFAEGRTPT